MALSFDGDAARVADAEPLAVVPPGLAGRGRVARMCGMQ
jgi:hypothetical protein